MRTFRQFLEDDSENWKAQAETGFWGRHGAGLLFIARDTGRFLINQRSQHVNEPFTWGTWGGSIDGDGSAKVAAEREAREETGYKGPLELEHVWTFKHPRGFTYQNFIGLVPTEFKPVLDWESVGSRWVHYGRWPKPVHSGLQALIDSGRLSKYADIQEQP